MKTYKITSEIKHGSSEEWFFNNTVIVKDILKTFTSLTDQQIKDAEYCFDNDHSYLYDYKYENNEPLEIFLTLEEIFIINYKNINEY